MVVFIGKANNNSRYYFFHAYCYQFLKLLLKGISSQCVKFPQIIWKDISEFLGFTTRHCIVVERHHVYIKNYTMPTDEFESDSD